MTDLDGPPIKALLTAEGAANALLSLTSTLCALIHILKNTGALRQEEIDAIVPDYKAASPGADVIASHMHCLLTGAQPPVFQAIKHSKAPEPGL